jgi:hypothetical protein
LHMLGKCSITELTSSALFYFILRQGLTKLPRMALTSWSFCFSLPSSWNYMPPWVIWPHPRPQLPLFTGALFIFF